MLARTMLTTNTIAAATSITHRVRGDDPAALTAPGPPVDRAIARIGTAAARDSVSCAALNIMRLGAVRRNASPRQLAADMANNPPAGASKTSANANVQEI